LQDGTADHRDQQRKNLKMREAMVEEPALGEALEKDLIAD